MWSFSSGSMNTVMKNNKALLKKKVSLFKSKKSYIEAKSAYDSLTDEFFDYKTATPELLEEIRHKFKLQRRKENRINALIAFVVLIVTSILMLYLFSNVFNKQENNAALDNPAAIKLQKKIEFYINDGDLWLNQGDFENAIFQYKKASKIDSNNFVIHYRICLGYSYLCRYEQKQCAIGKEELDKSIIKFPDKKELIELKRYY